MESLLLLNTKLYVRSVQPSNLSYADTTLFSWLEDNVYNLKTMKYLNTLKT